MKIFLTIVGIAVGFVALKIGFLFALAETEMFTDFSRYIPVAAGILAALLGVTVFSLFSEKRIEKFKAAKSSAKFLFNILIPITVILGSLEIASAALPFLLQILPKEILNADWFKTALKVCLIVFAIICLLFFYITSEIITEKFFKKNHTEK